MDEGFSITVYINVVQVGHTDSCNICNRVTAIREFPSMDGRLIGSRQQAHTTIKSGPYSLPHASEELSSNHDRKKFVLQEFRTASHDTYRYLLLSYLHMIPSYSFLITNPS
jgi:hypothetical protein